MHEAFHLAKRFFGSVRPGAPAAHDIAWVEETLASGEAELWQRMRNPDRRHAVQVARDVERSMGDEATRDVIVAALMHDVGKVASDLRTPARVVATLVWAVLPEERAGGLGRLGEYRRHPAIGEQLLIEAGAPKLASSWAADHHKPIEKWRVDPAIGQVLKDCDDD